MNYNETYTPDVFADNTDQVIHDRHLNKIEEGIKKAYELINQLGQELEALKDVTQVVPTNVSAFTNDVGYVAKDTTELVNYYLASKINELLNNKANVTHTHDDLIATIYKLGVVKVDGITTTVNSDGVISVIGLLKPDNTTIIQNADGTISVKGLVTLEYNPTNNTLNIKTS